MVSVIVPVYNAEKYLEKCIESIRSQTYVHLDIILVNDGSTDSSLNICRRYQQIDSRIRVISQKNQGLVRARITGLIHAKGQLVGFVDSDDWIEPDMYEQMVLIYKKYHADLISTGIFRDYEDSRRNTEVYDNYAEGFYENLDADIYPTMLRNYKIRDFGLYSTLVNKLYLRNKLLEVYKDINTNVFFGEDCMALYKYCLSVHSIYISRKSYYHYNIRDGSMCWRADERLPHNAYLLYQELKKTFMNYTNPNILLKQLRRYILDVEMHNLQMLFDIDVNVLGKWKFQYEGYYDSRIVLYGAGKCGQAFYHQLCLDEKEEHIAAWVDEQYFDKREQCLFDIQSPEVLPGLQYDYIIIAVMDRLLASQIKRKLMDTYFIKESVIVWKEVWHEALFDEIP